MIAAGLDPIAAARPDGRVAVSLDEPPEVVSIGAGLHGTARGTARYRMRGLWSLHLYSYEARLSVESVDHAIRPGYVSLVPPETLTEYRYSGPSAHLYAHLRIRDGKDMRSLPLIQDMGADVPLLTDLMRSGIANASTMPARTRADVWTVLLQLAAAVPGGADGGAGRSYVAAAMSFIEANLAVPLSVPVVARSVGISHNHLTRMFRAESGGTVVGYIAARRVERAAHLLRESTMPIASVAVSVGFPDLQAFNKTCRRHTGMSPRAIRAGRAATA